MKEPVRRPFLAWPGLSHVWFAWLLTLLVTVWFCLLFAATDWFTAHRTTRTRIHLDAELQIPLVPAFTIIYMSIYVLFFATPFVLRVRREITTLAATQAFTIFIAEICFLLIPAKLAFAPATDSDLGMWKPLFQFADRLNLDFNLVPSLHVALSIVCIEMFAAHIGIGGKILLRSWGLLIAASTVLTHQHHLLDASTGYLLALITVSLAKRVTSKKTRASLKLSTAPLRYSA